MEETKRIATMCLKWAWAILCTLAIVLVVFLHEVWQLICRIVTSIASGCGVIVLAVVTILLPIGALVLGIAYIVMWIAHKTYEALQNWQKRRKAERQVLEEHRQEVDRVAAATEAA